MSSDSKRQLLNQLLEALFELDNCEPLARHACQQKLDDLLRIACAIDPILSRDDMLRVLREPYRLYRRERASAARRLGHAP